MWTLPSSLYKMNKLSLQWKPILWCFGLFVHIGIYEIKCFQVTGKKWKHWMGGGKNWISSNRVLINLKRYVNPFNPCPTKDCMLYSMTGVLKSILNWWTHSIPFRSIYLTTKSWFTVWFYQPFFFGRRNRTLKTYM